MSFLKSIKAIKDRVIYLLENYPNLRDDDNKLIANIWYNEANGSNNILKLLSEGKLTNTESIRRCRQKIQEKRPDLRGVNYKLRKQEAKQTREKIAIS